MITTTIEGMINQIVADVLTDRAKMERVERMFRNAANYLSHKIRQMRFQELKGGHYNAINY